MTTDAPRSVWGDRWEALREAPNARGGQAQVWAVKDRQQPTGRTFALKLLDARASAAKLRRFAREVATTQDLRARISGIIEIVDSRVNQAPGDPSYYVMPWLPHTLRKETARLKGPAGLERTLQIIVQLGRTLAACHASDPAVVHRDVKPANILLDEEYTPVLADFGICFLNEDERLTHTLNDTLGSYGFTAPELFGGGATDDVGPAADIYSLGKTLYAVVSGGRLFPLDRHREAPYTLVAEGSDTRLAHVHGLLDYMTALLPADRFASMNDCVAALEQAIEHVRGGVVYVDGMYGGGGSAARRFYQLRRALTSGSRDQQHRKFVAGLNDAVSAAKGIASNAGMLPPTHVRLNALEYVVPDHIQSTVTGIADELLAPLAASLDNGVTDVALVEEWAERLAVDTAEVPYEDAERLFRAGVSVAVHAAGAIAWKQGFMDALAAVTRAHEPRTRDWCWLDVFSRDARGVMQMTEHVIKHAEALTFLSGAERAEARGAVAVYPGILLLRDLQQSGADVQQLLESGDVQDLHMPSVSCLYYPYSTWTATLGDDCAGSRLRRQALAQQVFGMSEGDLRHMLQRYRTAFIRLIAMFNRERSMHHMTFPGFRLWGKWSIDQPT